MWYRQLKKYDIFSALSRIIGKSLGHFLNFKHWMLFFDSIQFYLSGPVLGHFTLKSF